MWFGISRHYNYIKCNVEAMRNVENKANAVIVRMWVNSVHENVIGSRALESRCVKVPQLFLTCFGISRPYNETNYKCALESRGITVTLSVFVLAKLNTV